MAMLDVKFGGITPAPATYPAPATKIGHEKMVQCTVDVTNVGGYKIPAGALVVAVFYASSLSSVGDKTCEEKADEWFAESEWFTSANNESAIEVNETYTFTTKSLASYLSVGLKDASLAILLDTDGDGEVDLYPDCLLVEDAFEVIEWGASLGTPTFSEVE